MFATLIAFTTTVFVVALAVIGYYYNDNVSNKIQTDYNNKIKDVVDQVNQAGQNHYDYNIEQDENLKNLKTSIENDIKRLDEKNSWKTIEISDKLKINNGEFVMDAPGNPGGRFKVDTAGNVAVGGNQTLKNKNSLEFGKGVPKEQNAGKIGYQTWSDGLDVVGAGTAGGSRKVHVWDKMDIEEGINVMRPDPGPMIQKNYNNTTQGDRYGVGQFPAGKMRMYAANQFTPATVNLSLAKQDGSFDDIVTVGNDRVTTVNGKAVIKSNADIAGDVNVGGKLCVGDKCLDKGNFGTDPSFNSVKITKGNVNISGGNR